MICAISSRLVLSRVCDAPPLRPRCSQIIMSRRGSPSADRDLHDSSRASSTFTCRQISAGATAVPA